MICVFVLVKVQLNGVRTARRPHGVTSFGPEVLGGGWGWEGLKEEGAIAPHRKSLALAGATPAQSSFMDLSLTAEGPSQGGAGASGGDPHAPVAIRWRNLQTPYCSCRRQVRL